MTIAMALTMTVSAFAAEIRPFYNEEVVIAASVSTASKMYTVTVQAPAGTTQIKMDATLYQKQLIGRKQINTMSESASGARCSKSKSAAVELGKTYVIEGTAQVYTNGSWDTVEDTITVKT